MNGVLNFFIMLLLITLIVVAIIGLAALARYIWITARFTYVFKLQKYDEAVLHASREYNVITATNQQLILANENMDKSYSEKLVDRAKAQKEEELAIENAKKLNNEIKELENKLNKLNEEIEEKNKNDNKRGPGRPRKNN